MPQLHKNCMQQAGSSMSTFGLCVCVCVCLIFTEKRLSDAMDATQAIKY